MNKLKILSLFFIICGYTSISQIVINEYSASNSTAFTDNKGNNSDWVELYNTTGAAVSIGGWNLSDEALVSSFGKYTFPSGTNIPANGFLRIWCSGLGSNANATGHIHTNFKLTQCENEWIVLSNGGTVIDSLQMRRTQNLHSRARVPDGSATWKIFTSPTPNASNLGTSYANYAPTPVLSVNAGFYTSAQSIAISATPPTNITIRYTTNGDEPTTTSAIYNTPVNVTTTGVVRAKCYSSDATILPSFMETNTYFINETIDSRYGIVSISGGSPLSNLLNGTSSTPKTHFEYFDNSDQKTEGYGMSDKHGNDSWAYDQRGIDIETYDEYGYNNAFKYKFFTDWKMGASNRKDFQHIMIKAAASDSYQSSNNGFKPNCHMRDAFVQTYSFRKNLNLDGRRNKHVIVFKNGSYWGLYELREAFEADYTDYYYKQPGDTIDNLAFWGSLQIRNGSDTGWVALYNYVMSNPMTNAANYNSVGGRLNFMSLIDYMIYNSYVVNSDFVNWNSAWWRGRAKVGPPQKWKYWNWDMDNVYDLGENFSGLPTTDMNSDPCDYTNVFQNAGPNMGHPDMLEKLLTNPNFKSLYINRYADLLNSAFKCDSIMNHFNYFKSILTAEMPRQIAKWGGSMTDWNNNMNNLQSKIQSRCAQIESKISSCYSVTPKAVTVDVMPAGAGIVKLNSIVLPTYPWSGNYFAPVSMSFTQTVINPLYEFDYWEFQNHTPSPNINADSVSISFATTETVIAHYKLIGSTNIKVNVDPPGAGQVQLNNIVIPSYPASYSYTTPTAMSFTQTVINPLYEFDYWEFQNHTPSPNTTSTVVSITFTQKDSVVAHYKLKTNKDIVVNVDPNGAGQVQLNSTVIPTYPWTNSYSVPTAMSFTQTVIDPLYDFDYWEFQTHTPTPNTTATIVAINFNQKDSVIAHYKLKTSPTPTTRVNGDVVVYPTAFTPNGDGINDELLPLGTSQVKTISVQIWNRWGERVFYSTDPTKGWDGNYKGTEAPTGVYAYLINYTNIKDEAITLKGNITLVR